MTHRLTFAVLLALAAYGLVEAWPLLAGPSLAIVSPAENAPYPGGIVSIRGKAARATMLTLNGAQLLHDQEGNFSSTLSFPHGGSILTFVAADRFGRTVTETRNVFVPF